MKKSKNTESSEKRSIRMPSPGSPSSSSNRNKPANLPIVTFPIPTINLNNISPKPPTFNFEEEFKLAFF